MEIEKKYQMKMAREKGAKERRLNFLGQFS